MLQHVVRVDGADAGLVQFNHAERTGGNSLRPHLRLGQVKHRIGLRGLENVDIEPAELVVLARANVQSRGPPRSSMHALRLHLAIAACKRQGVGILLDHIVSLERRQLTARLNRKLSRTEALRKEAAKIARADPEDRVFELHGRLRARGPFTDHRRSERHALECARLFESGTLIEVAVEHRLGLFDQFVAFGSIHGTAEHRHIATARFDLLNEVLAARIEAPDEQDVDGSGFDRHRIALEIGSVRE